MRLAQAFGGLDALVGVSRRHADVGDDDVRPLRVHRIEQGAQVATRSDDLEVGLRLEQPPNALSDEIVILGENEPNRHGQRIRR